ncbi:MAG TPA: cyclic nucleotide-binding domain-containing protein [Syntrophales bacterium]|jgi:CRP-like cAMP-binding protein|nr:cyclic nucleotide-binding domain-containing protein [Syntrophales bacterium]HPC32808.1 cyclic nucleotide-binding domain-containing protein [Syntrophales bacterium]HQG34817.1 cyclic nucleotide-binding domain-containing protein [Syntrophales bacterium]HQJ31530.1 cyclic nucleotide-binding domain-containing protein [Syntrophales bacterium]HRR47414.1 cyclic nucleotide-binding domain-containing protein [Syntrophales bacterium]
MFESKFFKKGELIIEEGKTEEIAYLIQKGSVELFRMEKGKRIALGKLGVGSVIGEMSLLTGEAHATGVEALEDTGVNAISREDFETMLNTNPRSIIPILKEAFRKLIYMNQIAAAFSEKGEGAAAPVAPAAVEAKRGMRLTARTAEAERALKGKEVAVAKTPFNIGRATRDGAFDNIDLRLQDQDPYQLSRTHCSLVYVQNKYYVIDTSSTLGTTVDGVRIGKREALKKVVLEPGRHTLVLGSPNSPYRFELDIPEA